MGVRELDRYLDTHRHRAAAPLRSGESPWWLPGAAEDAASSSGSSTAPGPCWARCCRGPGTSLRLQIEERLQQLAADLQTSPELAERGEKLKQQILAQPELGVWVGSLWNDAKVVAAGPGRRSRLAAAPARWPRP